VRRLAALLVLLAPATARADLTWEGAFSHAHVTLRHEGSTETHDGYGAIFRIGAHGVVANRFRLGGSFVEQLHVQSSLGFGVVPEVLIRVFDRGFVRVGSGVMWLERMVGVRWTVSLGRSFDLARVPFVLYGGVDVDALRSADSSLRSVIPSIGVLTHRY
jgi:hypothetical protein